MTDRTSAREEILRRVRTALDGADTSPVTVPRGYRAAGSTAVSTAALVDLFAERVEDYRASVTRCGPDQVAEAR